MTLASLLSLRRLRALMTKELIQMRRDRVTFAMMIGVPLMQLMLFGFAINSDPKGLPAAVKKKLSDAAIGAMNDPAVKKRMLDQGLEIVASTPEAFTDYQAREFARWKTVIETRKITAD